MTRIIQGVLCLEKAYKTIFHLMMNTTIQFKFLEVRAVLLALKNGFLEGETHLPKYVEVVRSEEE